MFMHDCKFALGKFSPFFSRVSDRVTLLLFRTSTGVCWPRSWTRRRRSSATCSTPAGNRRTIAGRKTFVKPSSWPLRGPRSSWIPCQTTPASTGRSPGPTSTLPVWPVDIKPSEISITNTYSLPSSRNLGCFVLVVKQGKVVQNCQKSRASQKRH